jgi:hypothetical protein
LTEVDGKGARRVVFLGADAGEEEVRKVKVRPSFARSMSLADAMSRDVVSGQVEVSGMAEQRHCGNWLAEEPKASSGSVGLCL